VQLLIQEFANKKYFIKIMNIEQLLRAAEYLDRRERGNCQICL